MAYNNFIPQNVAPLGTRRIGIYNEQGNRVGQIPLDSLTPPNPAQRLYSFGAVSDIHLQYDTAQEDFRRALEYLDDREDVEFTCVCGDLTSNGTDSELQVYRDYIDTYSPDTPVYAIAGNHDATNALEFDTLLPYTGQNLWYSFEHNGDVFIMVGQQAWDYSQPFSPEEMQWLHDTLEANRNRRCFVFQHLLSFDGSGNPYPGSNPTTDILGCETTSRFSNVPGRIFLSLMRHYRNCVWFHGHSHTAFACQGDNAMANYDRVYGIHSVHIPSLAVPREYENSEYVQRYSGSEGYVVDVYETGIHLRGRDFAKGGYLPIASYWLDTPVQTVPAGAYTDPTGTIVT